MKHRLGLVLAVMTLMSTRLLAVTAEPLRSSSDPSASGAGPRSAGTNPPAPGPAAQAHGAIPHNDRDLYTPEELLAIYRHSPLGRLPPDSTNRVADDPQAAALGQALFFDPRFSANGKISCASCHRAALAFTDGRARAEGMFVGTRNTPTVLNAAFGQWYFLDGRSDSLWSQALQPFENPKEIGGDRRHIVSAVSRDAALSSAL
jgi:hypothetical protein